MDGTHVASLRAGQGVQLRVQPGERVLTMQNRMAFICENMTDSVRVQIMDDRMERYRIALVLGSARLLAVSQ